MTICAQSWLAVRLPCVGAVCCAMMRRDKPRGAPYLAIFPALIAVTLALLMVSGLVLAVNYDPWHAFELGAVHPAGGE